MLKVTRKTHNQLPKNAELLTALMTGGAGFSAQADWSAKMSANAFYTDNTALFSVTRRLSLKDDPTQPSVDRPGQGNDFVDKPSVELEWQERNALGETQAAFETGAYIFQPQPAN